MPPLSSFGFAKEEAPGPGVRYWPSKLHRRVIWPPAASGSLFFFLPLFLSGRDLLPPILMPLTAASPDNKRKPYGAPSVLRRGKAGAPLLKGQKPDIALRSCGQAQMGQMTSSRRQPSIRRSLHSSAVMSVHQQ